MATHAAHGLRASEAEERLRTEGPNELARDRPRGVLATLFAVLREPMLILLVLSGGLYFVLGDRSDAVTLLSFVALVIAITLVQERRTERALTALRDLASPRALVVRDGERVRVPGREVVSGDLVVLAEGDRVPADGVLVEATNLTIDESLLTGESVPVRKVAHLGDVADAPARRPGGDDLPRVFSGTLVVAGHGQYVVRATGQGTEMGRIGAAIAETEAMRTPLQREIDRIVRTIAIAAIGACVLLVATLAFSRGDFLHALLPGLTLAMALLPEEFPVVLTIFHAFGAYRISRHGVLARRVPAIEALGAATVLCTDKTGTLTENVMRIVRIEAADGSAIDLEPAAHPALPEEVHDVLEYGILASQPDPFDPMEAAFHDLGRRALVGTEHLHEGWRPLREYPLSPELLAMSHAYASQANRFLVAAKGAPDAVFDLCHLGPADLESLRRRVSAMASNGLRVLGVARAELEDEPLPAIQHDFEFRFVGLIGLLDPVRPEVPAAVEECRAAGIRVIMITGDGPETAAAIGRAIGLASTNVSTGAELDDASDAALRDVVRSTSIFARVTPDQKLRLVRALAANDEVVAMTGDGVNDAPALKAAQIGIAMGKRGTDVAREAAALVLVDDHFASIVTALRLGRGIYDNLRKAMAYVVAVHVPIAGMALLPPLSGAAMVLAPTHVALLQLVIDPACSLAFEPEPLEGDVMRRPPRRPDAPIFGRRVLVLSVLQGASVLLADLAVYALAMRTGDELRARTLAFLTLIAGDVALIHVNRSWTRPLWQTLRTENRAAKVVSLGAVVVLVLVLAIPALRSVLRLEPLPPSEIAGALAVGLLAPAWFELAKRAGLIAAQRRA